MANQNTAVIVLDIQKGIMIGNFPEKAAEYVSRASALLQSVRKFNAKSPEHPMTIVHVNVAFRPGRPEIHPQSRFNKVMPKDNNTVFVDGDQSVQLFDEMTKDAGENDCFVTKRRISALRDTDLAAILRGRCVGNVIIFGVATSGAILSTSREAADMDYKVTVLHDLCMDGDEEVDRVLKEKVLVKTGDVISAAEWEKTLSV